MKKQTICYDINLIPKFIEFNKLLYIARESGYLFYDSFEYPNAKPPYCIDSKDKIDKILLDVSDNTNAELVNDLINRYNNEKTD